MNICLTISFRQPFNIAVEALRSSLLDKKALRAEFSEFIKMPNLVNLNLFSTVYMSYNSDLYVSEEDANRLSDHIHEKFGIRLKPSCVPISDEIFSITDFTDFKDMIRQARDFIVSPASKLKREACKLKIENEENARLNLYHSLRQPMPQNIENTKMLALDFEFDQNKDFKISECGVSTYFNGSLTHEHYIVEGNYENKKHYNLQFQFNFGESKVVPLATLMAIVAEKLKQADYIAGHNITSEFLILQRYGMNLLEMPHIKPIDTEQLLKKHFQINFDDNTSSLTSILTKLNIEYTNLHNAGNDAAYTMEALLNMINLTRKKIKNKKKNRNRKDNKKLKNEANKVSIQAVSA